MTRHVRNERGIALVLSIIGLVVVGALVTGVFASSLLEQRMGQNMRTVGKAFSVAEQGLSEAIANWNTGVWNQLAIGAAAPLSGTSPRGTGSYTGWVRRLNQELFLVDVTGRDSRSGARQRLGAYVKLRPLAFDIQAALTTRGKTRVGGSSQIDGSDNVPWASCPPPVPMEAGIRIPDAGDVQFMGGCQGGSCINGNPKVEGDPSISDATFFNYGDVDWNQLKAMATLRLTGSNYQNLQPSTLNGQCNRGSIVNWGEPEPMTMGAVPECINYFPIIYAPGNLTINTGRGQGILLVEGDLNAQGNFRFYGITIVRGTLKTTGTGNHFQGGVLAANADLDASSVLGNAVVRYSYCAVEKATMAGSPGAQLRSRGWMQVY